MPIPVRTVGSTFPISELAGDVPPVSMPTPALSQTNRLYIPDVRFLSTPRYWWGMVILGARTYLAGELPDALKGA